MDDHIIPIIKKIEKRLESVQQSCSEDLKSKKESSPPPPKNISVKKNRRV